VHRLAPILSDAAARPHALEASEELELAARAGVAAVVALVAAIVIGVLVRRLGRRSEFVTSLSRRARRPLRVVLVVLVLRQVAVSSPGTDDWLDVIRFLLTAALIASAAWLLITLAQVTEDVVLRTYRVDVADNRHNRRVRTQVSFMRRLVVALVVLVAVAAMLLTIPEVRAVGTGILASAGLLSVVAGLAAQSALTNVFAGIQLAFTDAIRVDDVVVVETQFGKVEEITMTYIVVRLWDDRRLVLPSTYFTTTPFENWTRQDSALLGTVLLEVDWRTDVAAMREELRRVLDAEELWDGRVGVLQVTDAVGSVVQLRALVSAADAPSVFDLRCHVREALVRWLVRYDPVGLPRVRQENTPPPEPGELEARPVEPSTWDVPVVRVAPAASGSGPQDERRDSLFTGSTAAVQRSRDFSGPSEAERRARAAVDPAADTHQVGVSERGAPVEDPDATRVIPRVEEPPPPRPPAAH
jgi:small-conductance mechanosensitive channel